MESVTYLKRKVIADKWLEHIISELYRLNKLCQYKACFSLQGDGVIVQMTMDDLDKEFWIKGMNVTCVSDGFYNLTVDFTPCWFQRIVNRLKRN